MKKFTFLIFLSFLFLSIHAQVTITQADIAAQLALGKTVTTYADTLNSSVNIGSTGQSSWDFSGHPYQLVFDAESINPGSSPASGTFNSANYATYSEPTFAGVTSNTWVHLGLDGSAYSDLGTYTEATAMGFTTQTTIKMNPAETIMQLPLTFGANWSHTGTRDVDVVIVGVPFPQSYAVDVSVTRTVDAWGTLIMPDGRSVNVLRIKIVTELSSNVGGVPSTTTDLSFSFISPDGSTLHVNAVDASQPDNGTISANQVSWNYGSGATSVEKQEGIANSFSLAQNYPNPFNPTTTIQYSIPEDSHVSLKVFDVLGKEVAVLVNQEQKAGIYTSNFDASNLTSGIYFYTLTANNFTATKKLMLVK